MDIALFGNALQTPASLLDFAPGELGQWLRRRLPDACGQTDFKVAQLCADISLTHSHCCFNSTYNALIAHPYDVTLLVFGITGVSHFNIANEETLHTVRPGDIWLFNSGGQVLHRSTPEGVITEMVVLKYKTRRILEAFTDISGFDKQILNHRARRLARNEDHNRWLHSLLRNSLMSGAERLMAEAKALELLAHWMAPIVDRGRPVENDLAESDLAAIETVMQFLLHDLTQSVSLYHLARRVDMSHTRLNRCFKQMTGHTVFAWLRHQRLLHAENYLRSDKWSISDVAQHCGFSSASHFTQAFKAEHGCTPAIYRQLISSP